MDAEQAKTFAVLPAHHAEIVVSSKCGRIHVRGRVGYDPHRARVFAVIDWLTDMDRRNLDAIREMRSQP